MYAKHAQASELCVQIYHIKLCRKLLRAWFAVSINRLVPAYTHTYRLAHSTALRRSMHVWRALYVQRMYQHTVDRSMATSKKVRIFAHWRVYVSMVKQSRHIHSVMAKKVLNPVFRQWRNKVGYCNLVILPCWKHSLVLIIYTSNINIPCTTTHTHTVHATTPAEPRVHHPRPRLGLSNVHRS